MKNFYEFYRLIQERKLWEQEMGDPMAAGGQVGAPPMQGGMPPGGMPANVPPMQGDAQGGMPPAGAPAEGQPVGDEEGMSNVAPSEGELDVSNVDQALEAIAGMVDNFKSMDEEKGAQVEELVSQLSSLIKSLTGQEEAPPEGDEGAEEAPPEGANGMSPIPPGGAGMEGGPGAQDLGGMGGMPASPDMGTSQAGAGGMGGMGMAGGAAGIGGPPLG